MGKLFKYDCYDLRKFKINDIKTFIDIGANIGSVSTMARVLFPFARVIAIEPAKDTFELLKAAVQYLSVECYNEALGPNVPLWFSKQRHKGLSKFLSDDEIKKWPKNIGYQITSKTLPEIVKSHNIDLSDPFIIKIDCEGGEKYLRDQESIEIIKQSVQTGIEIHIPFGGSREEFEEFLNYFIDSHNLYEGHWNDSHNKTKYDFVEYAGLEGRGKTEINLVSKKYNE